MTRTNVDQSKRQVNSLDNHIGEQLRYRRKMLGLSQQDVADAVSVSVQQIQKYEKAINRIAASRLFEFAQFLQMPFESFFANSDLAAVNAFEEEQEEFRGSNSHRKEREREQLLLMKLFNQISDPNVRKKIIGMAKLFAGKESGNEESQEELKYSEEA